jgi:hypothetical protein
MPERVAGRPRKASASRRQWLTIRVLLVSGPEFEPEQPPGRIMLASTAHTFADLGAAIDVAFARWDHSHLHLFELESGASLMLGGGDEGEPDSQKVRLDVVAVKSTRFAYTYDLGDGWRHECEVMEVGIDPEEAYGAAPAQPVPTFGWGAIPDQYGRLVEDGIDE